VAVVLLVIAISAATSKPSLEDVQQEAANLAFAERTFAETHGRFTDDIAELGFRPSDGMDVRVSTSLEEDKFCVDAVSGDYSARAYDSSFSSDGVTVSGFGGLCEGPIRPGGSSVPPSWLDTSLAEPEDSPPVATEETEPLREHGLTAEEVVDSFTHRMIARYCESYYLLGLHDRSVTIYQHQVEKSGTNISWPFAEAIVDEVMSRCP
jgi:hypothetical protein